MEYGSVLELDDIIKYNVSEKEETAVFPFMKYAPKKYDINFYQSARNAIEDLLSFLKSERGITKVVLPDYVCQTVKDAAIRANVVVDEYRVTVNYEADPKEIEEKITDDSCVYICHFFGLPLDEKLVSKAKKWKEAGTVVVEDVTLSLLSEDKNGVGFGNYVIGSVRKWFSIPDGGFCASFENELPAKPQNDSISKYTDYYMVVQTLKRDYITNGCRDKALKETYMSYYSLSIKELFSDYRIYPMSEWSKNYLKNISQDEIIKKRKENYDRLYEKLSHLSQIKINPKRKEGYLPFGMVIKVADRDALLQYLIENDIYCNVHWRLGSSENNPDIEILSNSSLTIPCDQRYTVEDMDHIYNIIENWYSKNL